MHCAPRQDSEVSITQGIRDPNAAKYLSSTKNRTPPGALFIVPLL